MNYSHTPSDADSAYRLLTTILPLESPGFSDFTFEIAEGPAIPWDEAGFASLEAIVERVEVARRSGRDITVSGWKKRDPDQPSGSYLASGHFQVYYLAPLAWFPEFLRVEITTRPGLKPPPGFNVDDRGEYEEWSRDTSGTASLLSDLRAAFAHAGWDLEDFTLRCSEREGR